MCSSMVSGREREIEKEREREREKEGREDGLGQIASRLLELKEEVRGSSR
jgi:hypothetical protein